MLQLISSMATRELLGELLTHYNSTAAVPVQNEAGGGVEVAKRVAAGEAFDIVVLADNAINKLIADGKLRDERVDLVTSGVAIAVQQGAAQPDISSEHAVKQAVLQVATLSYSTGPSGVYLEKLFERWGILADIKHKIVVPPPGTPVGSLVAQGKCELGFQQLSELINLSGITVLGPLPESIQSITTFSASITTCSTQADAARAVLNYLSGPSTAGVKTRFGMQPV